MEHRTFEDLQKLATTLPIHGTMSRRQRLERWAMVLEEAPERPLKLLRQVEYLSAAMRASMRADGSPLELAFADPVLRQNGLTGDTLGEAESFFSLSGRHVHYLLCDCYFQGSVNAGLVASRIRAVARRPTPAERWDAICRTVRAWARSASPAAG